MRAQPLTPHDRESKVHVLLQKQQAPSSRESKRHFFLHVTQGQAVALPATEHCGC